MTGNSGDESGRCKCPVMRLLFILSFRAEGAFLSYYVWPPHSVGGKPLFFIPTQQVTKLVTDINKTLENCHLTLSFHAEDIGLALIFDSHPEMAPRYLGRSASKEKFNTLERHCPGENYRPNGEPKAMKPPAATILQDFKRKAQLVKELSKAKSKATQATREEQRHSKQQGWKTDLKQTERFLGLRPEQVLEPKGTMIPFESINRHANTTQETRSKQKKSLGLRYRPTKRLGLRQSISLISMSITYRPTLSTSLSSSSASTLNATRKTRAKSRK